MLRKKRVVSNGRAAAIVEAAAERAAAEGDATGEAFARAMAGYHRFNLIECSSDDLEALLLTHPQRDRGVACALATLSCARMRACANPWNQGGTP